MNSQRQLLLAVFVVFGAAIWFAGGVASESSASTHGVDSGTAPPALTTPAGPIPRPAYSPSARHLGVGPARTRKDEKLSYDLELLADAAGLGPAGAEGSWELRRSDAGDVQVYVIADGPSVAVRAALDSLGIETERVSEERGIVQARVPAASLRPVAALPGVRRVRLPDYPFLQAGSVQTQGDAVMNSDDVRSSVGVDGTGVTVGVISDGVGGLAASRSSGDLPAVDVATCNVAGGDPGAAGAEGTAMLEIVHDIAPGAALMFGNFSTAAGLGTSLDFNAAVDCLAANADVVVDDIGWFGVGPYDGTSLVSANTAAALNGAGPIRGYYTSASNQAGRHYQEPYADSGFDIVDAVDFWDTHEFDVTGGTAHAGLTAAPADFNRFALAPDGTVSIVLVWDDPWGASSNDYDLFVGDGVDISPCSAGPQSGIEDPVEACTLMNDTPDDEVIDIFIGNYLGSAAPVTFDLFLLCGGCLDLVNGNTLDFNTRGSSVPSQSDAGGSPVSVVSVGAVRHSTPNTIEPFSSIGLTEDGRLKPDVVAPDGVSITGAGGFPSPFFGTSAAAPHVAAVAALLLDCDPALNRPALHDLIVDNAIDLGDAGPDSVYGHGRVDALASATTAGCAGATPTATATETAEATPSITATDTPSATSTATVASAPTSTELPAVTREMTATASPPATSATTSTATPPATDTAAPTSTDTPPQTSTPRPTATSTVPPTDTPPPIPTPTATPVPMLLGDVDCNSIVNPIDAALILQLDAAFIPSLPCQDAGHLNRDGMVNSIDAAIILQFNAGLIDSLSQASGVQGWWQQIRPWLADLP